MSFKNYIVACRFPALTMTFTSMFVYFSASKKFCWPMAISAILFHLSVNTISEYRDYINGVDSKTSKGKSQMPIAYINNKKHIYYIGIFSFIGAIIFGLLTIYFTNKFFLLIPGIITAFVVFFYSEKPIGYKYKALGEIGAFLACGPLLCVACMYSSIGNFDLMLSIPTGLLPASVMLANNIRDYNFDKAINNKTMPTVLGLKKSYIVLFSIVHFSFFSILFLRSIPWPVFLAYPIMFFSIKYINTDKFFDVFLVLQMLFAIVLGICM